jgi:hypothetical protein
MAATKGGDGFVKAIRPGPASLSHEMCSVAKAGSGRHARVSARRGEGIAVKPVMNIRPGQTPLIRRAGSGCHAVGLGQLLQATQRLSR